MKLIEYNLRGWKYKDVEKQIHIGEETILLLRVNLSELGFKGRLKNLVSVDSNENILWIADIPNGVTMSYVFDDIKWEDNKLKAWRGNLYCEIDPDTGKVLYEQESR